MKWSRLHTLITGLVVVLITNAIALAGAFYNRSGVPGSVLELTERELLWVNGWGLARDNSGIELRIIWRVSEIAAESTYGELYDREASWLDQEKLRELGFDVSYPQHTEDGRRHYEKSLPRSALLVLEQGGPAFERALAEAREGAARARKLLAAHPSDARIKQDAEYAQKELEREETENSRLFVIDAGQDWDALRRKYPDSTRYAIVGGRIRMGLHNYPGTPKIKGYVYHLDIDRISVSAEYRGAFKPMLEDRSDYWVKNSFPFDATIAYGRRLEPWVIAASQRP